MNNMKVKELIEKLKQYNPEAETEVVAHCQVYEYSLTYDGPEGIAKENCENVHFYVDELCTNEKIVTQDGWKI
jgi:hypothetical protein